jgi:hypothetical protein
MIDSTALNNAAIVSAIAEQTDEPHAQSVHPKRSVNHNRYREIEPYSRPMHSKRLAASLEAAQHNPHMSRQNAEVKQPQRLIT